MVNYKNGKIYRLVCSETNEHYFGSTCSPLSKRFYGHKSRIQTQTNGVSYLHFKNPKIFLVEDYPCERKEQLLARERYYIENYECCNKEIPGRTKLESNRKSWAKNAHNYREMCRKNAKDYYDKNKDEINKTRREAYLANPNIKKEADRKSYYNNHEKRLEKNKTKVKCPICNLEMNYSSLSRHKSKQHK